MVVYLGAVILAPYLDHKLNYGFYSMDAHSPLATQKNINSFFYFHMLDKA